MKFSKILLATSLWITPLLSITLLSSASPKYDYSFFCYLNPENDVYSTRIGFSDNIQNDIIYWSKHPNPKKQCASTSSRFQEFKKSGRLNHLLFGKSTTGENIVCGLATGDDVCDDSSKIFALLRGTSPEITIIGLGEAISGENSPIYQGSDELIVNFENLIAKIRQRQEKKR